MQKYDSKNCQFCTNKFTKVYINFPVSGVEQALVRIVGILFVLLPEH